MLTLDDPPNIKKIFLWSFLLSLFKSFYIFPWCFIPIYDGFVFLANVKDKMYLKYYMIWSGDLCWKKRWNTPDTRLGNRHERLNNSILQLPQQWICLHRKFSISTESPESQMTHFFYFLLATWWWGTKGCHTLSLYNWTRQLYEIILWPYQSQD